MLQWFKRQDREPAFPLYSALVENPSRGLPPDLVYQENSKSFEAHRDALQRELLTPQHRPADDEPLFSAFIAGEGVVTLTLDDGQACVPIFSTPIRAADYARTQLAGGPPVQYLASTPAQCAAMLRDLFAAGIEQFAIDRCPRCAVFTLFSTSPDIDAAAVLSLWAIAKSSEIAREDLYFMYALRAARRGKLSAARDVALESAGHVTLESPRIHLLLGETAIGLKDKPLLHEAKAFLRFLSLESLEKALDADAKSARPNLTHFEER